MHNETFKLSTGVYNYLHIQLHQMYYTCYNNVYLSCVDIPPMKIKWKTSNTTLLEQFKNPAKNGRKLQIWHSYICNTHIYDCLLACHRL